MKPFITVFVGILGMASAVDVQNIFVNKGGTAVLKCTCQEESQWVRSDPQGDYFNTIIENGKARDDIADHIRIPSVKCNDLEVSNITQADEGSYDCLCKNGTKAYAYKLNITENESINVTVLPSGDVIEGTNVTLVCSSRRHTSGDTIKWKKYESCNGFQQLNGYENQNMYQITNVTRNDNGTYACLVGNNMKQIYLYVHYLPEVFVERYNNMLTCTASGGYPTTYSYKVWEHQTNDGLHIRYINGTEDGSLELIQDDLGLVHENNGKYICTVENGIRDRTGKYLNQQGEITVNIEGSHSCSSDIVSQKGFITHNFTFNVEFYSFVTDMEIEWYKGVKRISQNQTKYDICVQNRTIWFQNQYYYMNTASLFISNLESNDFGSYSIRISNIHGECWRELIIYDSGNSSTRLPFLQLYILITGSVTVLLLVGTVVLPRIKRLC